MIIEVLSDLIRQEELQSGKFWLDTMLGLALVYLFTFQNLLFLLYKDTAVLVEEAFEATYQELANKLKEDVFVVSKILGKHLFQDLSDSYYLRIVILEIMGGIF